jgi:hypothetical protein
LFHFLSFSCPYFPLCLVPVSVCSVASPTFISVFHCLLLLSLCSIAFRPAAACCTISLFHCLSGTSIPVFLCLSYFYLCVPLFDTPIEVFSCLSTCISVFQCLCYSYPFVPSSFYLYLCVPLRLLFSTPMFYRLSPYISVFYCLCFIASTIILCYTVSAIRLHVLHCFC